MAGNFPQKTNHLLSHFNRCFFTFIRKSLFPSKKRSQFSATVPRRRGIRRKTLKRFRPPPASSFGTTDGAYSAAPWTCTLFWQFWFIAEMLIIILRGRCTTAPASFDHRTGIVLPVEDRSPEPGATPAPAEEDGPPLTLYCLIWLVLAIFILILLVIIRNLLLLN